MENTLKCFAYKPEDEEWDDESLGKAGSVKVHSASALAADIGPDGITLFFQNEQGKIQTLVLGKDGWELGEVLPAAPRLGTALSTISTDTELLLFYLATDNVMHYQAKNYETETWEGEKTVTYILGKSLTGCTLLTHVDRSWETVKITSPVSRFKVSHDAENNKFEAHVITDGKLVRFTGTDDKVDLGTIKGRELIPFNAAQSVRRTFMSGFVIQNGRLVGAREYHARTHYHRNGSSHTTSSYRFYPI